MTNFYDDPMDENGNYHYGHFDEYFSDSKRAEYFICNDTDLTLVSNEKFPDVMKNILERE